MTRIERSEHTSQLSQIGVIPRRRMLQTLVAQAATAPLLRCLSSSTALAADEFEPLNRFPRMVHEFFVNQVRESEFPKRVTRLPNLGIAGEGQAVNGKADVEIRGSADWGRADRRDWMGEGQGLARGLNRSRGSLGRRARRVVG